MPSRTTKSIDLTTGEPLLASIARRPRIHLPIVSASLFLIALAPILAACLEDKWASSDDYRGLRTDYAYFINIVVQSQLIILVAYCYCRGLASVLSDFKSNGVVQTDADAYANYVHDCNVLFSRSMVVIAPFIVATITASFSVYKYVLSNSETWQCGSIAGVLYGCAQLILNYLICLLLLRIVLGFVAVSRFFRFDTHIQPLHPDGCGGLAPLGRLLVYCYPLILVQGISIAIGIYQDIRLLKLELSDFSHLFLASVYLVGSSVIVFLPLYSAHSRLKEAKNRMLTAITRRYEVVHAQVVAALAQDSEDMNVLEKLNRLRELHAAAQKMSVYPVNTKLVISFFVTIGVPILGALYESVPVISRFLKGE